MEEKEDLDAEDEGDEENEDEEAVEACSTPIQSSCSSTEVVLSSSDCFERNRSTSARVEEAFLLVRGCSSCRKAGRRVVVLDRDLGVSISVSVSSSILVKKP